MVRLHQEDVTVRKRKSTHPRDDDKLGPTQVAAYTNKTYHTARNMMLRGDFGPSTYEEDTGRLWVLRRGVDQWLRDRTDPAQG